MEVESIGSSDHLSRKRRADDRSQGQATEQEAKVKAGTTQENMEKSEG